MKFESSLVPFSHSTTDFDILSSIMSKRMNSMTTYTLRQHVKYWHILIYEVSRERLNMTIHNKAFRNNHSIGNQSVSNKTVHSYNSRAFTVEISKYYSKYYADLINYYPLAFISSSKGNVKCGIETRRWGFRPTNFTLAYARAQ